LFIKSDLLFINGSTFQLSIGIITQPASGSDKKVMNA